MKRLFQSAILWRLAAIALIFSCAGIAAAPQALGSGPTVAVTEFSNDAGAPQSTIDAMSNALYQAVGSSGRYTTVGGGPIKVPPFATGPNLVGALTEAGKVGAEEVIISNLVGVSGGSVTYRLTAYRVNPVAFIRDQVFTQSSLAGASLAAGFVTNLATLHAPRTAIGTIYSVTHGVQADLGTAAGFNLGEQFNVVRTEQRMAQAKITSIDLNTATLEISNPASGYKPQIGDQLVGVGPQPAVPPAQRSGVNTFSILGLIAATGAALLAIGHHGQPAGAAPAPSPTSTTIGGFSVTPSGQSGSPPAETFTFTFSQPVKIPPGGIPFSNPSYISYSKTNGGIVITPANTPVTNLGGPTPSFNSANTVLTIGPTNTLNAGDVVTFAFTSLFQSTFGVSLTPTNVTFIASVARHPAALIRGKPVRQQGGVLVPAAPQGGKPQPPGSTPNGSRDPHNPR